MDWYSILVASLQLFIITDPLGNLPIFFALTKRESYKKRHKTFLLAVISAFALLLLFAIAGGWILTIFRFTLNDLKIAGGILLLVISVLLLVKGSWLEIPEEPSSVGVVPLGCPILVGPGAITTAMVLMGIYGVNITLIAILINFLASFVVLYCGESILKIIGKEGSDIISRIMVILIAAIAVHYIREGIVAIIQGI